jgi:hypothetical protein
VLDPIVIDPRFNGPADSANGGYACGLLATAIDGPAEVTLRRPPPLGRALRIHRDRGRALMLDGVEIVAEAAPTVADWSVPPPVSIEDARGAIARSPFLARPRPFVTCFVCGPDRPANDGLSIFPGPLLGLDGLHAGTWFPDRSLADERGVVRPEFVWASLDCPTSGPVGNKPAPDGTLKPIVLAQFAADVQLPVVAGMGYVVTAWPIAVDGRKRYAGSALFTAGGQLLASARALWIELREPVRISSGDGTARRPRARAGRGRVS